MGIAVEKFSCPVYMPSYKYFQFTKRILNLLFLLALHNMRLAQLAGPRKYQCGH